MIQESLILGTLWWTLCTAWRAVVRSPLGRAFDALCAFFARQWSQSLIVNWFCHARYTRDEQTREPTRIRVMLCALYEKLGLVKLVDGSMFLHCFVWCALSAVLTPFLPTMASLGLTMVGYGAVALTLLHEKERRLTPLPLSLPVGLYALCYLVGTLTSVNLRGSLYVGILTIVFVLFSLVLYRSVGTQEQLDLLTAGLVTAAAVVSVYGILQYKYRWGYQSEAWVDSDMFSSIRFRVSGTFQNPNMMGQYLVLMIPLGGAKLLGAKDWKRRLFYLACCGVMVLCILLTFSRGAWLGLLLAGLAFFVLLEPRLLFLAPFALIALYFVLPDTVIDRFTSIGNLADRSTSYRVSIWLGTLRMLADGYWLLGIGPGDAAYNEIYPFYSYHESVSHHSHNLFLQIVCDAGIAALLVFLWILLRYFRLLCAAMWKEKDRAARLMQIGFTSGMLGFLVQAMTDFSFYNYRVMLIFWVYLAAGALSARRGSLKHGGMQLL